ncbi:MAG: hypothetical protein AAFQ07_07365, partial [Chloroflexota bacterium]
GEVTPTPAPEDTEDNNEEEQEEVDVEELINEALEQLNDGEFRGAVATMDVAIDADPTNVFAYTIRGVPVANSVGNAAAASKRSSVLLSVNRNSKAVTPHAIIAPTKKTIVSILYKRLLPVPKLKFINIPFVGESGQSLKITTEYKPLQWHSGIAHLASD